ncbi:AAA family ATPase [Vibrio fluvialis]|uniref:AAA family ATPase n=1 Tax=Vibrio fluvialis TaxID=676 RepID=UPI001EEAF4E5|nr:AAA family ATPase [Vibrio fluvialis]MCG6390621.1 AAA family ATPase [Vibrio fluvialis]MCG6419653.1 AAA family ATPase [Vibrio fluvialis]
MQSNQQMNETSRDRKVLCTIEKSYHGERDEQLGKLKVFFEILPNGDVTPINSVEEFCFTNKVFVTSGFGEIKEKFGTSLFEATCTESRVELKDGDCKYVTRFDSCEEIKGLLASQVYEHDLPSPSDPNIFVDEKPITRSIMLFHRTTELYYGPFEYDCVNPKDSLCVELSIKALSTPFSNAIPLYHVGKFSSSTIAPYKSELTQSAVIIGSIKKLAEKTEEKIDFITDDQIISMYGNKVAQSSAIRNFTKGTVGLIRKHFSTSKEYRAFPDRFQRLLTALEQAESWDSSRNDIFESFLKDKNGAGHQILERYIEENKERFFQSEKEAFKLELQTSAEEEKKAIAVLRQEKEKLESENRRLARVQTDLEVGGAEAAAKLEAEKEEQLSSQIIELQRKLDHLQNKYMSMENKYKQFKTLDDLEQEIQLIERERDRAKEKNKGIEQQLESIRETLKSENDELTRKLVKLKPEVDALCGITPRTPSKKIDYNVKVSVNKDADNEAIREDLIDSVLDSLNSQGRKTDYYTAANILTTVAQCQFTLFSGLPGTGKTSLAKMLGQGLGLGNRFLNIPVARGWTSSRDVLGFYNALSQSYVPSSTGMYELLSQLDKETCSEDEHAASIVLLDEFNLSQPEHYFSPFMEIADPESRRIITTGDIEKPTLNLPNYLRFLGTINQDESVQALTPRMLDRAAIINFDEFEPNYDLAISEINPKPAPMIPISGKKFIEIFTATSLELKENIEGILHSIVMTLRDDSPSLGNPVLISYRKLKAIRAYQNVASPLMYENTYAALDYAVSQHIIPLLNGYGEGFGQRLDNLLTILPDEMERSNKMLSRIIAVGKQNMCSFGANL